MAHEIQQWAKSRGREREGGVTSGAPARAAHGGTRGSHTPGATTHLPRLVGRELAEELAVDELPTARHAAEVGHRVVDNDERDGEEEPKEAVENVGGERVHLHDCDDDDRDGPCQLSHLILVHSRLERKDSANQQNAVQHDG